MGSRRTFMPLVVSILVSIMATVVTALDTTLYSGMEQLDPAYLLYWKVDQDNGSIRFAVKAKTAGYVALGISEVGAMVGSDMMIGSVENGMAVVIDAFAFNKSGGVLPDFQQDVKTLAGEEYVDENGDTWTVLEFSRSLNASECNDRPIEMGANQIIWALGTQDITSYHGDTRGSAQLAFYGIAPDTVIPPDQEKYNLTAPEYIVPTNYTTYVCNTFNMSFPEKRHITSYSVIYDTNAPQALHHIVVHACLPENYKDVSSRPTNLVCGDIGVGCSRVFAVWAVGGKPVVLPEFAGLAVGPGTQAEIVVMQIHYTNPDGRSDIVDRSGISFTLAPKLRPIDAGMFAAGPYYFSLQIRIPPGEKSWKMESTCSTGCTMEDIKGNITIIGSTLHQHVLGKQLWTTLSRGGKQVSTIGRADYYDFNFQTMVRPPTPVTVFPGDVLKTTCIWDSSARTTVTVGGESTLEEMCMNYLLYYPLQENLLGGCLDACITPDALQGKSESPFQPAFEGNGMEIQFCTDYTNITTNNTCLYGPTGGQSEVVPPLAGCPASSVAEVPASTLDQIRVPAQTNTTTQGTPASTDSINSTNGCTSSFGGSSIFFQNCQSISGGYSLNWNTTSASTVRVGFSKVDNGWIAFGISPSGGMVGASAIIGFPSTGQGVTVNNYFLGGKSANAVQPPGKLAASSLLGEYINGEVRLLFTLNLTADQMANSKIVWASGSHGAANGLTLNQHSDAYMGTVSFATGATTTTTSNILRNAHGIINALAWGILIPLGAMLARYAKAHAPTWFYAHITVQTTGFLLGLCGLVTGFVLHNRSKVEHTAHLAIAIVILALSFLQIVGSLIRPKPDAENRWKWNLYHHWAGRSVIALAIANIYIGLSILKPGSGWVIAYSVILGVIVASVASLEARKVWMETNGKSYSRDFKVNAQPAATAAGTAAVAAEERRPGGGYGV